MTHVKRTTSRDDYTTPVELFQKLLEHYWFQIDLAASKANSLTHKYFSEENSFLASPNSEDWMITAGSCSKAWCNPPFSKKSQFLKQIVATRDFWNPAVVIVPNNARESKWWNDYALQADEIINLTPRVNYLLDGEKKKGVAFGSCLLIYRPRLVGVEYGLPKELYWNWKE